MTTLARRMTFAGALLLTLSAATPASSVFVVVPEVIAQAGTGALWSLLAAAIVAVCMGLVYAELSSAYPLTGGEYAIVGHVLGPAAGFVILGVNLTTLILGAASLALGVSDYLRALWPAAPPVAIALAVVAGCTGLGVLNIRLNALVTGAFLAVEMLALGVVAGLGFSHVARPMWSVLAHPVALAGQGALGPASLSGMGLAVTAAVFAFDGYGSAVYFGEETAEAPRAVARAVLWSLAVVVVSELAAVAAMLVSAPDLHAFLAAKSMPPAFIRARGGAGLASALGLGVALAIVNAVLAILLIAARQLYSTGRDRVWTPAVDAALERIHPRLGSPWVATLAAGGLTAAACLAPLALLLVATGTAIVVVYAALCVALILRRRRVAREFGVYRSPLHPLPALVCLGVLGAVVAASAVDPAVGLPSLYVTAATMIASAAYYALVVRRRGVWRLYGPVAGGLSPAPEAQAPPPAPRSRPAEAP